MTDEIYKQIERAWYAHNRLLEAAMKALAASGVAFEEARLLTEPDHNGGKKDTLEVRGVPAFEIETTVALGDLCLIFTTHPPKVLAHGEVIYPALRPVFAELSELAHREAGADV